MCGILCFIRWAAATGDISAEPYRGLVEANARRGPDYNSSLNHPSVVVVSAEATTLDVLVDLYSSVLHLRGNAVIAQPHVSSVTGNRLCWNGEVFEGLDVGESENDGSKLFALLDGAQAVQVPVILAHIEGPYAFLFYHKASKVVYFGRDPLGRRSLLVHRPTEERPEVVLTSVSDGSPSWVFEEVSAESLHCIDLQTLSDGGSFSSAHRTISRGPPSHFTVPAAVNIATPSVIDLDSILDPLSPPLAQAIDELIMKLDVSVGLRVKTIPRLSGDSFQARVGVLFSGGIDCSVVALLADRHIPRNEPIDLLNVAFENPRSIRAGSSKGNGASPTNTYLVPDRVTGLEQVEELRLLSPHRVWNFVEIDVPFEESTRDRVHVEAVMRPAQTVMDLSLAQALYFASRGKGVVKRSSGEAVPYTTTAKVLLSGLGSDELLGGYSRHKKAFRDASWQGLIDELQLDVTRLPSRNLGRDDRVISSNGKEARYPFLSLTVLAHVSALPIHFKVDPRLEDGQGDKRLLRLAAQRLGLLQASRRKKRAMQFGTRSAKMEGGDAERRGDLLLRGSK